MSLDKNFDEKEQKEMGELFRRIAEEDYKFDEPLPKSGVYHIAVCYDGYAIWGENPIEMGKRLIEKGYKPHQILFLGYKPPYIPGRPPYCLVAQHK